ncbi:unnamed protein product [marine sediment metagenome]|uniref:Uncharacterized protein n=1 Tax=marine sediment metagenome TaxID=412755 RepID=X1K5G4_9ZZZZ
MSDYGADVSPNLELATEVTKVQKFAPWRKTNVMQWTHQDGTFTQKYAHRFSGSNIHIKFKAPIVE